MYVSLWEHWCTPSDFSLQFSHFLQTMCLNNISCHFLTLQPFLHPVNNGSRE